MIPINIIGAITGALSGATGGKLSLDRVVTEAVAKAAQSPANGLRNQDVVAVADAVRDAMPKPQAMESLWPQIARQGLVFLGGFVVAKGWVRAEDWAILSGAVIAIGPVLYRIVSTLRARAAAKG
jgi:hypothetical protein